MCQLQTSLQREKKKKKLNRMREFLRRYQLHFYCEDNEKNKSAIKYKIQFFFLKTVFCLFFSYHFEFNSIHPQVYLHCSWNGHYMQ